MPAMSALTVTMPPVPAGGADKGAGARGAGAVGAPATSASSELVTIADVVDTIEVMSSLQKPKKVGRRLLAG